MQTFEYRGLDRQGRTQRGLVDGHGPKDCRERLAAQGILVERLSRSGRAARITSAERGDLYESIAALLGAGLPLVKALDTLIEADGSGRRLLLAAVRDRVREGAALAEALGACCAGLTPAERAVLEAAERASSLAVVLGQLAHYLNERRRTSEKVQSALIYPTLVVGCGLCVAILMLGVLLPRTEAMLGGMRALPPITVGVLAAGRWFLRLTPLALAGGGAVVAWTLVRRRRDPAFRIACDQRVYGLPGWGPAAALLAASRFARTAALLLEGGVAAIDAVRLAGRATGNAWVAALTEQEAERVRHGASLSEAIGRVPPLSSALSGWVRVGEAGGGLAALLARAATRLEADLERKTGRAIALIEPLLIVLIGVFVLLVTLAVLLPVLSLTQQIGTAP